MISDAELLRKYNFVCKKNKEMEDKINQAENKLDKRDKEEIEFLEKIELFTNPKNEIYTELCCPLCCFKKQLLEEGKFEVKHKDFAIQIGELSKRFIPFKEHNSRQFILALIKIIAFNKCDIELLFKKINERPDLLIKCDTMKDYCILLEDIYLFIIVGSRKRRFLVIVKLF